MKNPMRPVALLLALGGLTACGAEEAETMTSSACPESDTSPTVVLKDCDTTVANRKVGECTLADLLHECNTVSDEEYARCIARKTNTLMEQNVITGADKGNIQICAGDDREQESEQPGEA